MSTIYRFHSLLTLVVFFLVMVVMTVLLLDSSSIVQQPDAVPSSLNGIVRVRQAITARKLKETTAPAEAGSHSTAEQQEIAEQNLPEQVATPPMTPETRGYVLIESLPNEQLPVAMAELLTLQCWAGQMKMDIVEPSIQHNTIMTPLHIPKDDSIVSLDSIFNMATWSSLVEMKQGNQFIEISEVNVRNIKHVIVVDVNQKYNGNASINCMGDSEKYRSDLHSRWGLQVTQELCLDNQKTLREVLETVRDFVSFLEKQMLTDSDGKVAVIFRQLGKIFDNNSEEEDKPHACQYTQPLITARISPSDKLLEDAQAYLNSKREATSAIIVSSNVLLSKDLSSCFERILTRYHSLKLSHNLTNAFLSYYQLRDRHALPLEKRISYKMFFRGIYSGAYTPTQWDEVLLKHSRSGNKAYLNVLKQVISSHSKCLILTSNDFYTRLTLNWYNDLHQVSKCVVTVKECLLAGS